MSDHIDVRDDRGVRTLAIGSPDRAVTVLSPALREALIDAVDAALADDAVRGLVLTGAGGAFVAGADLTVLATLRGAPAEEVRRLFHPYRTMLRRMEQGGKPVVAALNGTALGGGFELALACHHRILADAPGAVVGLPEATLGLLAGAGGTQRLPRLIGLEAAMPLLLDGTRLAPEDALERGVVDAVVPPGDLLDAARAWIESAPDAVRPWDRKGFALPGGGPERPDRHRAFVAEGARRQASDPNDPAAEAILSALFEGTRLPIDDGLVIEGRLFARLARGDAAQNRIRAFFSQGRARKAAARPARAPRFEPRRLGILGAGTMGAGLAEVAARAGLDVVLLDRDDVAAARGVDLVRASLDKAVARGKLGREDSDDALRRIRPTAAFADLAGADAVIEAVFEDRDAKRVATEAALAATGPDVLFASNTSKLPITGLAETSPAPDRFIGMHFFSPVPRMRLVEIIRGGRTGDRAVAEALDLARLLGKTAIVVNDAPGFFTSRVVSAYVDEGLAMLMDGVAPALIENVARQAGWPQGPLALADGIGLGTMRRVRRQERADRGDDGPVGASLAALDRLAGLGREGRGAGGGFHDPAEDGPRLWPGLARHFPAASAQPDPAGIRLRLLHAQSAEAARAWDEGVVEDPRMADVGSLLGWAHPAWTGGVMSFADQSDGVAGFVARARDLARRHGPRFAPAPRLVALAEAGGSLYG